jgi:hypothetical protein
MNGNLTVSSGNIYTNSENAGNIFTTTGNVFIASIGKTIMNDVSINAIATCNQTYPTNDNTNKLATTKYTRTLFNRFTDLNNIYGLTNWYDASDPNGTGISPSNGDTISTWVDKSPNGNNMIAQSTIGSYATNNKNGLGTITFNNSWYISEEKTSIDLSSSDVYVVLKLNNLDTAVDVLSIVGDYVPNTDPYFNSLVYSENNVENENLYKKKWINGSNGYNRTTLPTYSETSNSITDFIIIQWSIANNNLYIYRNGVQIINDTTNQYTLNNLNLFIGRRNYYDNQLFKGSIAEVVVFNNQLVTANRQKVEGYLAWKWGLEARLPTDHPYYNIAPTNYAPINSPFFTGTLNADDISMNGNLKVSGKITCTDINCGEITCTDINCDEITCTDINCGKITSTDDIKCGAGKSISFGNNSLKNAYIIATDTGLFYINGYADYSNPPTLTTNIQGNLNVNSGFPAYNGGVITAISYNATSDYRIKENIREITYTVDNLKPIHYTNKYSKKDDIGLIAHELQEYIPFLVTGEKDGKENQTINYTGLIGILIKEIQELKKRVYILEENQI